MSIKRTITRIATLVAIASGASIATATAVHAYPQPPASAHETAGCTTVPQGQPCTFTFRFVDANGNGVSGLSVSCSESGVPGSSVSPTNGVTDPGGSVSTTFTASTTNTGTAIITCSSGTVSASATTSVTSGAAGTPLPNTGTSAPGANSLLYLGLGLALMIILGGAITLRRSRSTAS